MESECTSHIFGSFPIFLQKIIEICGNLTKFWQKQICLVFLGHGVVSCGFVVCCCCAAKWFYLLSNFFCLPLLTVNEVDHSPVAWLSAQRHGNDVVRKTTDWTGRWTGRWKNARPHPGSAGGVSLRPPSTQLDTVATCAGHWSHRKPFNVEAPTCTLSSLSECQFHSAPSPRCADCRTDPLADLDP